MEHTWNKEFRSFLYICALLWCFLGVSVLSDAFMAGIEEITNSTKEKQILQKNADGTPKLDGAGEKVFETEEALIWNPAVANLSLMALGSSTPEILLGIYETLVKNQLYSGDLGPGTIVGSASFNLFVITAMCMVALPDGEGRKIDNLQVYALTASHSMFVYVWLFLILAVISPNVVTVAEALVTLFLMPWLIILVWLADNNWFMGEKEAKVADDGGEAGAGGDEEAGRVASDNNSVASKNCDVMRRNNERYFDARKNALRHFMGSKKPSFKDADDDKTKSEEQQALLEAQNDDAFPVFQFPTAHFSFLETVGNAKLSIMRMGKLDCDAKIAYETVDGTAKEGKAYSAAAGTLTFKPYESVKHVYVAIIHDDVWTQDQSFYMVLSQNEEAGEQVSKVGKMSRAEITIIDMDSPGIFCWVETATQDFMSTDSFAYLIIERRKGCSGEVQLKIKTVEDTAFAGVHFEAMDEVVKFADGEASKTVKIKLLPFKKPDSDSKPTFTVALETTGEKGGAEVSTEAGLIPVRLSHNGSVEEEGGELITWPEQFRQSLSVGGGEDMEEAGGVELFMHYLSITWKLCAAVVPPPHFHGGVPCFSVALIFIGIITAFIGDIASVFGCLIGLNDAVTAITLVALGTSLPDTFASMISVQQDDNADNAIGNVTGSNAVNVFLGLGLPYSISAIYWVTVDPKSPAGLEWKARYGGADGDNYLITDYYDKGQVPFVVIAGNLGFNVMIFVILAFCAIAFLFLRRMTVGFELGGPAWSAKISACILFFFWIIYVVVSSLQEYHPTYFINLAPSIA